MRVWTKGSGFSGPEALWEGAGGNRRRSGGGPKREEGSSRFPWGACWPGRQWLEESGSLASVVGWVGRAAAQPALPAD
ncbi:MAG: hypothetical protein RML36_17375, partial [Anaerolineae bacterium]|nr:hypothetical protein [Anaerolineae bacterium]